MTLRLALAASLGACLAVPAAAGTARPVVALSALPARLVFAGAGRQAVRVENRGAAPVVVDAAPAGFALGLRGRPRVLAAGAGARLAAAWLRVAPARFALPPGGTGLVAVAATPPAGAAPGDHPALVLLTSRPRPGDAVAVRMRIGVTVLVRVPGRIVHRLEVRSLRVRGRVLTLAVRNRGNVVETLARGRLVVSLRARRGVVARLRPRPRELLPRALAVFDLRLRAGLHGRMTAVATLAAGPWGTRALRRSARVRL